MSAANTCHMSARDDSHSARLDTLGLINWGSIITDDTYHPASQITHTAANYTLGPRLFTERNNVIHGRIHGEFVRIVSVENGKPVEVLPNKKAISPDEISSTCEIKIRFSELSARYQRNFSMLSVEFQHAVSGSSSCCQRTFGICMFG